MLSARSSPIKHKQLILRLWEAVRLPAKLAVVHCKGHQKGQEEEAQGNRKADQEAKRAAREATPVTAICPLFPKETLTQIIPQRNIPDKLSGAGRLGHMGGFRLIRPK